MRYFMVDWIVNYGYYDVLLGKWKKICLKLPIEVKWTWFDFPLSFFGTKWPTQINLTSNWVIELYLT